MEKEVDTNSHSLQQKHTNFFLKWNKIIYEVKKKKKLKKLKKLNVEPTFLFYYH